MIYITISKLHIREKVKVVDKFIFLIIIYNKKHNFINLQYRKILRHTFYSLQIVAMSFKAFITAGEITEGLTTGELYPANIAIHYSFKLKV